MPERRSTKVASLLALTFAALSGFPARAQVVTEFSAGITAGPRLLGIALGADRNVWFTESDASSEGTGNRIGRITPQGIVTEFSSGISAGAGLGGIAAGPDGNLWFAEQGVDRIGRITLGGVVTEFGAGISAGAGPVGITAGPDGNLWFVERGLGRIGRITPAGAVTEFQDGITPGALPTGITLGPDGNLWFTESGADRVGRITTAGIVTEFAAGITPGAILVGIAAGPDGNVWFTELGADRIARVTPDGVVTEFGAGISPGAQPQNLALGPDGNLWFTERAGSRIGRITPAGVVTEFGSGITAHSRPAAIAAGEGADLWFTEDTGGRIGRITIGGSPAGTPLTIAIEPAHPTATDDIVVVSPLAPGGCRLLDSPFVETHPGFFEGLVFTTAEPSGCPFDAVPLEARVPLKVAAPGTYHVVLWKIIGGAPPTPGAPATRADADVTVGDAEWLIPAVARADGVNGARWTTDLEIFSTSAATDTAVTLTFLANGGAEGGAPRTTISVPPLGAVRLEDVLGATFGVQQGSGALLVTSPSTGLRFAPSIGTPSGGGRIAQPVPAVPGRGKLRTRQSGVVFGIEDDDAARTNLALANAGDAPAVVDLVLEAVGMPPGTGTLRVTVPARGMTQVNRVVRALRVEEKVAGARLTVTAVDSEDGIAVLASVIDNATNAPLTLTPQ